MTSQIDLAANQARLQDLHRHAAAVRRARQAPSPQASPRRWLSAIGLHRAPRHSGAPALSS